MKKIISSLAIIAAVSAVVIGGTTAFFTDTEKSTGNVFTAGSVSLELGETTHQWLGAPNTVLPANYFNLGETNNILMGDLKPGDNGLLATPVTNGKNDSFLCAKVTAVYPNPLSKIADYLKFRTGTGPGGSVSDILAVVPVGQWFSPTAPALGLQRLPLAANASGAVALEYCFGDFTPGSALGMGCVVDLNHDYNNAQLSSVSIDLEYYVIQQRNNENFSCSDLNPSLIVEVGTGWSPESAGTLGTNRWVAKARYGDNNPNAGAYELELGFVQNNRAEKNASYVNGVSQPFTLSFNNANKVAIITVGSYTTTYTVAGTPTAIGITAKGDATRLTSLTNIMLNSKSVSDVISLASGNAFASLTGPEVSGDFTLSGDLVLTWGATTNQENPTLQIDVLY